MINCSAVVSVLIVCACAATAVTADHYATKQDYLLGKVTASSHPQPRAGGGDCTAPTPIAAVPFELSGDTTGAGSAVFTIPLDCNGSWDVVGGPEHVYSFTVTPGNNLTFTLTTSSDSYDPSIWTSSICDDGDTHGDSCIVGAGADDCYAANSPVNPCLLSDESFNFSFAPGTYFFFVDSFYVTPNALDRDAGPYTLMVTGNLPVQLLRFEVE